VATGKGGTFRRAAPWLVSAAALAWVFGRTDWVKLLDATRQANLPLFLAIMVCDKAIFFLVWALVQAEAVRRFVVPVSRREVLAVRGGSELFRAVNNPLADAAFLLGLARLAGGKLESVIAASLVPFAAHLMVLLAQASAALFVLPGGPGAHRDVLAAVAAGWGLVGAGAALFLARPLRRVPVLARVGASLDRMRPSELLPFVGWFAGLAAFDVLIQGLGSIAFGVPIPWTALAARIPLLYLALAIPSVSNFGVREFAWAGLFADYAPQEALFAYAFATNSVFLLLNVLIGTAFLRRAFDLLSEVRSSARAHTLREPLLHDAIDP
jgi:hypothetical protein